MRTPYPARRRNGTSPRRQLTITLVAVGLAGLLTWVALRADEGIPGASHYVIQAAFSDISNLGINDDVRIAGRRVGQVTEVSYQGGEALARLQLNSDIGPLPADTTARVRAKGLLGARYLELRPGRAVASLRDGETIPSSATSATQQLTDVLKAFDPTTRLRLREFVRGFGGGLMGRGAELNQMLADAVPLVRDTTLLATELLRHKRALGQFVPSVESAMGALAPVSESLAEGFDAQAEGLRPFARSRDEISRLLDVAPGSLEGARSGLAASSDLLHEATGLVREAKQSLAETPAALRETRLLLAGSHRPLRTLRPLLDEAERATPDAVRLLERARPIASPTTRGLEETRPTLDEVADRRCDFRGFVSNWRSMLEWGVPGGDRVGPLNVFRFTFVGGEVPGANGRIGYIKSNPYPEPCQATTEGNP